MCDLVCRDPGLNYNQLNYIPVTPQNKVVTESVPAVEPEAQVTEKPSDKYSVSSSQGNAAKSFSFINEEKQVCEMPDKLIQPAIKTDEPVSYNPKVDFTETVKLQDGVNVYMPKNPVKADGTVDIIIQFRGMAPQRFGEGGVNAIVIGAETDGLSEAMMKKFGSKDFVPQIIEKAMVEVKKKFGPDVKEGKLALGSFSAGYAPLQVALSNPEIRKKTDAVIVIDGIHYGKEGKPDPAAHQPFVDFAKEAAGGNKLMVITHSSIKTPYSSSTNAADYIQGQVNAKSVSVSDTNGLNYNKYETRYKSAITPSTRADLNGFHVEGYNGNKAESHVEQIDNIGNTWNKYLSGRWKE